MRYSTSRSILAHFRSKLKWYKASSSWYLLSFPGAMPVDLMTLTPMADFIPFSPSFQLVATGLVGALLLWWLGLQRNCKINTQYPPGPPKHPLWGNLRNIPVSQPWLKYNQMAEEYGDIVHLDVMGDHIIILSSFEAVRDLVDRKSSIYSDRPVVRMLNLINWDWTTALKPYGAKWQRDRRIFMQQIRAPAIVHYRPIQTKTVHRMLCNMVTSPQDTTKHYKTASVGSVLSIMYGYGPASMDEGLVSLSENTVQRLSGSAFPIMNAVNIFGFLRFIPSWFPGAAFKRYADESREMMARLREAPLQFVRENTASGMGHHSLVSDLFAISSSEEERNTIEEFATTSYSDVSAGADAVSSSLGTFFLAMATHPHVQKKAQDEIDMVVGTDRLVTFEDRKSLPYVDGIFREVSRWKPVFPLGVPHATTRDDFYRGYYIPKGTTVLTNISALSHDPQKYPEPDTFNPDRYLDKDGNLNDDEVLYAFGFGRRICPGRHLSIDTMWLVMASVLATFNVHKTKDASGNDILISGECGDGLLVHPLPFEYSATPRSSEAVQIIMESIDEDGI